MEEKTQSDSVKELATALSKAQSQIKGAIKDSSNPYFKSTYADLTAVWEAAREPLTKNGLSVVQTTVYRGDKLLLVTTLLHSAGEWIRGEYLIKPAKEDPQGYGSAMTYARRYALSAIVGISPEDDDGEAAMARPTAKEAIKTYNEAKTSQPVPTAEAGKTSIHVKEVSVGATGNKNGNKWTKYIVTDHNGVGYSTFDEITAETARRAKEEDSQLELSWIKGKFGLEVHTLKEVEDVPF